MPPKSDKNKDERMVVRTDQEWLAGIDEWRGQQRPIPSRSEVVRMAVIEFLAKRLGKKGPNA